MAAAPSGIPYDAVHYWTGTEALGEWETIHTGPGRVAEKLAELGRRGYVAVPGRSHEGAPKGPPSADHLRQAGALAPSESPAERPILIALANGPIFCLARDAVAVFADERGPGPRLIGNLDPLRLMPELGTERYLALREQDAEALAIIVERMGIADQGPQAPETLERVRTTAVNLAASIRAHAGAHPPVPALVWSHSIGVYQASAGRVSLVIDQIGEDPPERWRITASGFFVDAVFGGTLEEAQVETERRLAERLREVATALGLQLHGGSTRVTK